LGKVSDDLKRTYEDLWTFIDFQENRELILNSVIVVLDFSIDFCLWETVGVILIFDIPNIASQQRLTEPSVRKQKAGGLHLHARTQIFVTKILVTRNFDLHKLVP